MWAGIPKSNNPCSKARRFIPLDSKSENLLTIPYQSIIGAFHYEASFYSAVADLTIEQLQRKSNKPRTHDTRC
jgi:hypothetical protein